MKFSLKKYLYKQQKKGLDCLNCNQPLNGNENFCSCCGQINTTEKLSLSHFFSTLLNGLFSYDSRLWSTFIPLLFKPGKVSKEYIEGKRAKFVNPFQLYLNVSIVFFLVVGISNKIDDKSKVDEQKINTEQTNKEQLDSILDHVKSDLKKNSLKDSASTEVIANMGDVFKLTSTITDSIQKAKKPYQYFIGKSGESEIGFWNKIEDFQNFYKENNHLAANIALKKLGYRETFWNTFYYQQVINADKNIEQIKSDNGKSFIKTLTSYLSISLFIFLPFFALFLKLVYIRRRYTYMEHLVFVFNVQTVFFLLFLIFYLLNVALKTDGFLAVFFILFFIYLYKALRHFYQQTRLKTFLKLFILINFYFVLAIIGLVIVGTFSFLTA